MRWNYPEKDGYPERNGVWIGCLVKYAGAEECKLFYWDGNNHTWEDLNNEFKKEAVERWVYVDELDKELSGG